MVLYKYASAESGLRILEGLNIRVSPPNQFNDPFELTPFSRNTIDTVKLIKETKCNPERFRPIYDDFVRNGFRDSFKQFLSALPEQIHRMKSGIKSEMRRALAESDARGVDEASAFMGILCLSATKESVLMWSHYARDHTGVVIGLFAHAHSFDRRLSIDKVKYRKHRAKAEPHVEPRSEPWCRQISNIILTKSVDWSYEKEYRMVFHLNNLIESKAQTENESKNFFIPISPDDIREVIMGCRISKKSNDQIKHLLSAKRFSHVRLYQAVRHRTKFGFDFHTIPVERRQSGSNWLCASNIDNGHIANSVKR